MVIVPDMPEECPEVEVTFKEVMELANRNNPFRYMSGLPDAASTSAGGTSKSRERFKADVYAFDRVHWK